MIKGIDISEHNGVVDFEKIIKSGIQFVMIRAGYGQNNIDKQFERNIKMCNQLEIPCGVYWFSYALTEEMARQEAVYCVNAIKPYKVTYPVVFDFEYDSVNYANTKGVTITKEIASKMVVAFCSTIENSGYFAANYANTDYLNNMFDKSVNRFALWLAAWSDTKPDINCVMWQYADNGNVDGIGEGVDLDYSYTDFTTLGTTPTKEMTVKEALEIVREKTGFTDLTMQFLQAYKYDNALILKLGKLLKGVKS